MISRMIIFVFCIFGTTAFADPEDDAEWYMSHFIPQRHWDGANKYYLRSITRQYYKLFQERNIAIEDEERFNDFIPQAAADEAVQRLKLQLTEIIIEGYEPDHLSAIANFFRTPFGEEMMAIAKEHDLFVDLLGQTRLDSPILLWRNYLSTQQRFQFFSFANTPAGQVFTLQNWAIRRKLHYQIADRSLWSEPPLDRPYIIEIIQADGILRFPNPVLRKSLLTELSATSP